MFTSLRARLWLSYAIVIAIALGIVTIVLFVFLIRNPVLTRQTQQQLRTAQSLIRANPREILDDPKSLERITQAHNVRVLVFTPVRELVFDSNPNDPGLPFPRRNLLGRNSQTALDASGNAWLYAISRLPDGRFLMAAAPRPPKAPVLNIFTDEFLLPIIEGGLIALLLSLVLAFAISRWVADPLQQVVAAARDYPSGEIKPVSPRGPREVQDLTRAFNSMVRRVQGSQKSQRDFIADVSHELKTPLTSIQGFAQAILDDMTDSPDARRGAAQIIYNEAGRMHRMALDLLDLARFEAGTADMQMTDVDAGALLRGIVEKFALQSQKAQVNLQANVPHSLPPLNGDGDRLAQVFTNLVDNALRFTPANGRIVLSAKQDGDEMELSVEDSGSGVASDALPHLFDRFYQADPSRAGGETATVRRGAGLGLAIAREIIQAHGGRISVRSQAGHGTTFVIHLPLAGK